MSQQQSPIFTRTESFMAWTFEHTAKFPRHERFRMAKRIDDTLFDFHAALLKATTVRDTKTHLNEADYLLKLHRSYWRLAVELKHTTPKQYQHAAEHTNEIGRLLGGWLKKA